METLKIACEGAATLTVDEIAEFQGELKSLSEDAFKRLKTEMMKTGFSAPIHVWRSPDGPVCIDGHQRLRTLKRLRDEGLLSVPPLPVIFVEARDKEEAKRRVLQMISQYGKIEKEGLYEFIHDMEMNFTEFESSFELPGIDLESFKIEFFDDPKVPGCDEDETPEVPHTPRTVRGDIYQLGNHRLMCGDSTLIDDVEKLMDGETADMVFTDPPYGINIPERRNPNWNPRSQATESNTYRKFNDSPEYAKETAKVLLSFSVISIIFGANHLSDVLPQSPNWVVWHKRRDGQLDRNSDCELAIVLNLKNKFSVRYFQHEWKGMVKASERGERRVHAAQKPIALAEWCFENYAEDSKSVLDLFGGSGSTLIACEKTNRRCFMMELDPHYCDVIVSRYAKFSKNSHIILNDQEVDWHEKAHQGDSSVSDPV